MGNNKTRLSLFELNNLVKEVVSKSLPESYWVIAEIGEINEHSSGHCYLELIQKDESADNIKARAKSTIWSYTYRMLKPYFETTTNRPLARGMKVLVNVQIVFHELYGYSLNIIDIEPSYTLGDIELKRRETITKLINDGVMGMNKDLEFPLLPKNIAIISSRNAAGLQDFTNQLTNNQYGYRFKYEVFPATMQGDEAEKSIINALTSIYNNIQNFDVAVIVRGGGAQTDLSCFDSYQLSSNVAQFPLPILTGIGHDKDISVTDMVAYTSLKTPTAVAEFLISKFTDAEAHTADLLYRMEASINEITNAENELLKNVQQSIQHYSLYTIAESTRKVNNILQTVPHLLKHTIKANSKFIQTEQAKVIISMNVVLHKHSNSLAKINVKIKSLTPQIINTEKNKHNHWHQTIHNLNPDTILQKGYSITYYNGKILKDASHAEIGSMVETKLKKGKIIGNIVGKDAY